MAACTPAMFAEGVVTLSQTERNLPTTANVAARDFKHLAGWSFVQIGPIPLNVTMPFPEIIGLF
jgi:hypothetical protein